MKRNIFATHKIDKFVRKHGTIHCKNHCSDYKLCQYVLNSMIHECQIQCNYSFMYEQLYKYVGKQPSFIYANLLPYNHNEDRDSTLLLRNKNIPFRFWFLCLSAKPPL